MSHFGILLLHLHCRLWLRLRHLRWSLLLTPLRSPSVRAAERGPQAPQAEGDRYARENQHRDNDNSNERAP